MAHKFLTPIDLTKLELLNARIQNLASAPGSPVNGLVYYDTTLNQFGSYQNGSWVYLGASASNAITRASVAGGAGELIVAAGADRSAQAYTTAGLLKIAAGIVAQAVAGTDYSVPAGAETLTNKTINATNNTITNLTLAMFAANIADTDVTLAANSDLRVATQKAIKTYVDALVQGIRWKQPVRAATVVAGTLASSFANGSTIDGVTLATNDRILIKDQSAGAENGIYTVNASGAPTRATDADVAAEVLNMVVDVQEGTVNADQAFVCTNNAITLGTTALVYVDFVKANVPSATTAVAGKVVLATLAEAEAKADTSKAVVPADLLNFPIKKLFTIGDGSATSIACTHNLGTKDVQVQVRDAATDAVVIADIVNTSTTVTTITFAVAPASNAYKVVIEG
jgi:hypothetical protein